MRASMARMLTRERGETASGEEPLRVRNQETRAESNSLARSKPMSPKGNCS